MKQLDCGEWIVSSAYGKVLSRLYCNVTVLCGTAVLYVTVLCSTAVLYVTLLCSTAVLYVTVLCSTAVTLL